MKNLNKPRYSQNNLHKTGDLFFPDITTIGAETGLTLEEAQNKLIENLKLEGFKVEVTENKVNIVG